MRPIMSFFSAAHLPDKLAEVSDMFVDLAVDLDERFPQSGECDTALRRLLEAKDCAVRAQLERGE